MRQHSDQPQKVNENPVKPITAQIISVKPNKTHYNPVKSSKTQ